MNIIHERKVDRTGTPQPYIGIAFAHIHRPFRRQHDSGELQLHCAGNAMRWPFKISGLVKFLGEFLILMTLIASVQATGSVTLAWNASTDPSVAGYNVYYGGASGAYTNEISVGNATNETISGLIEGITYYFAATTYTASGMESPFSGEVSCLVPLNAPIMNYTNTYTAVVTTNALGLYTNHIFNGFWIYYPPSGVWTLQSSSNLLTWFDYATGTNAVFVPKTGGNWFFRFKSP